MPRFSGDSEKKLATCHQILQNVFRRVVADWDCTIREGHRGQAAQDLAFTNGFSKLKWPHGPHNGAPSMAVDVHPFPHPTSGPAGLLDFALFGGYVLGVARGMGIALRWGGDWNGNRRVSDETFKDLYHFELVLPK